jgi:hypothetical protein
MARKSLGDVNFTAAVQKNTVPVPAVFEQSTQPTGGVIGDIWVDTQTASSISPRTITTSDTAPLNPSNGDMWMYTVDGTCFIYYVDATGGQWVEQSRSVYSAATYQSPNYLINGAFDYWQRWTGTAFSSAGYTADRWAIVAASGQTVSVSQQAFTPGTAPVAGYEGAYFCRMAWTGTPSGYFWFTQRVEDVRTLAGQTATLSFWAKAGTATTAFTPVIEQNFGSGGGGVAQAVGSAISLTTSWQRYSVTLNIPSISGKTIGTSSYLDVRPLYSGSTGISANNIDIWGVQLESGTVATPFRRNANSLQAELAACQRYYEKSYNTVDGPGSITESGMVSWRATNTATATQTNAQTTKYQVPKRIYNGVVHTYSPYTGTIDKMWNNSADVASVIWAGGTSSFGAYFNASTVTNAAIAYQWTCDAEL